MKGGAPSIIGIEYQLATNTLHSSIKNGLSLIVKSWVLGHETPKTIYIYIYLSVGEHGLTNKTRGH